MLAAWINLPLGTGLLNRTVYSAAESLPPLPPFHAGQRVLVLAPHPDDETRCCAGMIQQGVDAGATVHIVWVTPGDGSEPGGALLSRRLDPTDASMQHPARTRVREARTCVFRPIPGTRIIHT